MVLGGGAFRRQLGRECGAFMDEIGVLIESDMREDLSQPCEDIARQKRALTRN